MRESVNPHDRVVRTVRRGKELRVEFATELAPNLWSQAALWWEIASRRDFENVSEDRGPWGGLPERS